MLNCGGNTCRAIVAAASKHAERTDKPEPLLHCRTIALKRNGGNGVAC
jgi:hypothetical protein